MFGMCFTEKGSKLLAFISMAIWNQWIAFSITTIGTFELKGGFMSLYKTELTTPNWNLNMAERHAEKISQKNEALREQLHSLFERVSGCEVSEFSSEQVNYLADMIEGQMDANEGCINKIKSENAALREALRLKELECEALAGDKKRLIDALDLQIMAPDAVNSSSGRTVSIENALLLTDMQTVSEIQELLPRGEYE